MPPRITQRSGLPKIAPLALLFILLIALPLSGLEAAELAPKEETPLSVGKPFNGSFTEYSARAGLTRAQGAALKGWSLDAGLRHSLPMYLGDSRLAYRYDSLETSDASLSIHGTALTTGLHPFYLALLSRGLLSHFLSSLHLELGLGVQRGLRRARASQDIAVQSAWGFTWSVGSGFDLPLTNPNRGSAPWLNVVYRYGGTSLSILEDVPGSHRTHALFAGIGWRINGLAF